MDASKLGVSMSRIQRGLRLSEAREQSSEYAVQARVSDPGLRNGAASRHLEGLRLGPGAPLSYGAPTHNEFLNHWTPQAYRSPPADFGALAGWALFQLAKRSESRSASRKSRTTARWSCRASRPPHRAARSRARQVPTQRSAARRRCSAEAEGGKRAADDEASSSVTRRTAAATRCRAGTDPRARPTPSSGAPRPRRARACSRSRRAGCAGP